MTNKVCDEWTMILNEKVLIFGAKYSAGYLYDLVESMGKECQVLGFLVTDISRNENYYKKHKVIQIDSIEDKSIRILIPSTGKAAEEIKQELENHLFSNVYYVSKLIMESQFENNEYILEEKKRYEECPHFDHESDSKLREEICSILADGQPRFGGLEPYQSLERIGLIGKRPTTYRIEKYGLKDFLREDMTVLDIGCNTSFIDFSIANSVNSVLGIEHEPIYTNISKMVKKYLEIKNVDVWQGEFTDWFRNNNKYFDMILSFAVHRWIGVSPQDYGSIIDQLLTEGGYVCLESHVGDEDAEYEECVNSLEKLGFRIEKKGSISDSRDGYRDFIIAQK